MQAEVIEEHSRPSLEEHLLDAGDGRGWHAKLRCRPTRCLLCRVHNLALVLRIVSSEFSCSYMQAVTQWLDRGQEPRG